MSSHPEHMRLDQAGRAWTGLAFLFATASRTAFALAFPTIHGGDAAARLANADRVILGYQLPLPQALVVLGKAIHDDPLLVRLTFCLFGGLLAAGVTALLGLAVSSRSALFGSILLSFDPLLTHYSIVPYQETVAYALLAWAFHFAASHRLGIGALLMAASCLSRYEAWLFLPLFLWVSRSRWAVCAASLPVFGWIVWWQGLAPSGLYVLDLDLQASRLSRIAFLGRKFVEYETAFVVVLAMVAIVWSLARPGRIVLRFTAVIGLVMAVVVAFGHEYPPGSGVMSERLIHLPVLLALPLAAMALDRISGSSRLTFSLCLAALLLLAGRNVRFETALLRVAEDDPDLALARKVASAIEANRTSGECVTVLAPRVDKALLDAYVSKVGASFGDVVRARERADALAAASPDRDRIAAHLRARVGTIRSQAGCPLLVFVDDAGTDETRKNGDSMARLAEITAGPRRARILRIRP